VGFGFGEQILKRLLKFDENSQNMRDLISFEVEGNPTPQVQNPEFESIRCY